jgi:hypothetical protein
MLSSETWKSRQNLTKAAEVAVAKLVSGFRTENRDAENAMWYDGKTAGLLHGSGAEIFRIWEV